MSFGDFSSILAASASGTVMAERQTRSHEEVSQRDAVLARIMESHKRAQKTEGIGALDHETESSHDREGDGRLYRYWEQFSESPSSQKYRERSRDPNAQVGKHLDILG